MKVRNVGGIFIDTENGGIWRDVHLVVASVVGEWVPKLDIRSSTWYKLDQICSLSLSWSPTDLIQVCFR